MQRRKPYHTRYKKKSGNWVFVQLLVCLCLLGGLMLVRTVWPGTAETMQAFVANHITGGLDVKAVFMQAFGGAEDNQDSDSAETDSDKSIEAVEPTPAFEWPNHEENIEGIGGTVAEIAPINALLFENDDRDAEDDTPPVPFGERAPAIVDFTEYPIGFPHGNPLANMRLTSGFGFRMHPINGAHRFHFGVDLGGGYGTSILAFADGEVYRIGYNNIDGNYIRVRHADGFSTMYAHAQRIVAQEGQRVQKGETIALVGSTGASTGPHLHFEIRRNGRIINPLHHISLPESRVV
ncbi:MAG: M23 family metallopeptidase [Oscillospiraceae bacterium]|nr:M23 family metallopeptidase [Oscillospiraceae bacterium]